MRVVEPSDGEAGRVQHAPEILHGTVLAHGENGVLIVGPSGSGKSDLALRCLVHALSPMIPGPIALVADDYCEVTRAGDHLEVRAPEALFGKIEVRGIGIIEVAAIACARLAMVVELVEHVDLGLVERMPDPGSKVAIQGVELPVFKLFAFESSAPAKLLISLARGGVPVSQS